MAVVIIFTATEGTTPLRGRGTFNPEAEIIVFTFGPTTSFGLKRDGHAVHPGQVCNPGALADAAKDRGEPERVRAALLGDGAVLPEPGLLGVRAAGAAGRAGPAGGCPGPGRAGAEGEERQEGDQGAQHPALHQGVGVEGTLWEGSRQAGTGQRRRQDLLHHREGAADQRLHLGAQGEQHAQLRLLHRWHRGGHPHAQRLPRQGHRALAQGHHAHDQVRRVRHRQGQGAGREIGPRAGGPASRRTLGRGWAGVGPVLVGWHTGGTRAMGWLELGNLRQWEPLDLRVYLGAVCLAVGCLYVRVCLAVGCLYVCVCLAVGCLYVRVCLAVGCLYVRVCLAVGCLYVCVCLAVGCLYVCVCLAVGCLYVRVCLAVGCLYVRVCLAVGCLYVRVCLAVGCLYVSVWLWAVCMYVSVWLWAVCMYVSVWLWAVCMYVSVWLWAGWLSVCICLSVCTCLSGCGLAGCLSGCGLSVCTCLSGCGLAGCLSVYMSGCGMAGCLSVYVCLAVGWLSVCMYVSI